MTSRPYKIDYVVYPYEMAYAFATNPASGCKNCNPGDILCELGKAGCEAQAAVLGTSNALQNNTRKSIDSDIKKYTGAGKAATDAANSTGQALGGLPKNITDSLGGFGNWLQESAMGTSHAFQEALGKGQWPILAIVGVVGLGLILALKGRR